MPELPVLLQPAKLNTIPDHALPPLPSWYPVQPDDEPPLSEVARARRRARAAREQASRGPYDGERMRTHVDANNPPPATFVPFGHQDVRYVLDRDESTRFKLVYRYDTTSPIHRELMAAVVEAFNEASPEYVRAARAEDDTTHERPKL